MHCAVSVHANKFPHKLTICRRDTSASSAATSTAFTVTGFDVRFPLVAVATVVVAALVEASEVWGAAVVSDCGVASWRFDLAGGTSKTQEEKHQKN